MESTLFPYLVYGWLALAVPIFFLLQFITAPYGRHYRKGWGASVGPLAGWLLMEVPAVLVFPICLLAAGRPGAVELTFLAIWLAHYVNRGLIFPFRLKSRKRTSLLIACFGIIFNVMNGYLNGRYLGAISPGYDLTW